MAYVACPRPVLRKKLPAGCLHDRKEDYVSAVDEEQEQAGIEGARSTHEQKDGHGSTHESGNKEESQACTEAGRQATNESAH